MTVPWFDLPAPFEGKKRDPITGREISRQCWNSFHEPDYSPLVCLYEGCNCMCHDEAGELDDCD